MHRSEVQQSAAEPAPAVAANAGNTTFSKGFRMNSNAHPSPSSDLHFFRDATLKVWSNLQPPGNVKMYLKLMGFEGFPITIRFPGSP